jgi:predicted nucleic acid-binding Zn ribbon protein
MAEKVKKSPKGAGPKMKRPIAGSAKAPPTEAIMAQLVPKHKHCFNCGVSVPPDKDLCSDRCQTEWDRMVKRKKYWTYLPLLGVVFLILIYIIMNM